MSCSNSAGSYSQRCPRYQLVGGQGRKPVYLYDTEDPTSVIWADAIDKSPTFVKMDAAAIWTAHRRLVSHG